MAPADPALDLRGIFPPIPTPFDEGEALSLTKLESNLERWNQQPHAGYVVGGSNGEFVSLNPQERLEVLKVVSASVAEGRLVIAGSGLQSTRETLRQTEAMAQAGADAALVVTPGYYKSRMEPAALIQHYRRLADASPIPVILYNVPANTGIDMSAQVVLALSEHENIVGLKDSSGDVAKLAEIARLAPPGFQLLAGSAGFLLGALSIGAVGTIAALANLAADELSRLMEAHASGEQGQAAEIQRRLAGPNRLVTARYGVAGLKYALSLQGFYGGPVRSPLMPLSTEQQREIKDAFREAGLL